MSSNVFRDMVIGAALPTVGRPTTPSPFDIPRMDISDRFRPRPQYSSSASASVSGSTRDDDPTEPGPYSGELNVTGIGMDVMERFVGMPRGVSAAIGPTGLGPFVALGSAISSKNLTDIQNRQRQGEAGYAVGMLNGRIIGLRPGVFGGYSLSGVLPEGLTPQQRNEIIQQLVSMSGPRFDPSSGGGPAGDIADPTTGRTIYEQEAGAGNFRPGFDTPFTPTPEPGGTTIVTGHQGVDRGPTYIEPDTSITYTSDPGQDPAGLRTDQFSYTLADTTPAVYNLQTVPAGPTPSPDSGYYGDPGDDSDDTSPATGGADSPSYDGPPSSGGGGFQDTGGFGPGGFRAKGGAVQRTGFVEGSPDNYTKGETVADTVNTQVRENSFVLNAPTVETLQRAGMLPTGVDKSNKNTTIKANKGGLMPVALSKGEYVIEPEEAQRIGYSFLEKLNDQGKAEVDRRQAAADGGFINGYQAGGKTLPTVLPQPSPVRQAYVGEDIDRPEIPLTDNMIAQFKVYNNSKKQRKDVENLINALDDRENLALVALAETTAETDDIEAMMGVQTTVINRVKSKAVKPEKYPLVRRDFKNVTDVKSALKQRTPGRGSGSFMFQYDGFEPKYLSPKIDSVLKGQVPAFAITKIMASSANVLDPEAQFGGGLFPDTVTFYTREDAPLAKDMELNPQMRYVTTLGGHDFYSYEAAPESPDEEKIYKEYLAEKRKKKKN